MPNHKPQKITKSKKVDESSHQFNTVESDDSPKQTRKIMTRRMARAFKAKSIKNNQKITSFMKEKPNNHQKNDFVDKSGSKDAMSYSSNLKNDIKEKSESNVVKNGSRSSVKNANLKKQELESDSEELESTSVAKETKPSKDTRKKNSKKQDTHCTTSRGRSRPTQRKKNQNKNLKPISPPLQNNTSKSIDSNAIKDDCSSEVQKVESFDQSEDKVRSVAEGFDELNIKSNDIPSEIIVEKDLNENQDSVDIKLFTDEKNQTQLKFREVSIHKVLRLKEMIRVTSIEKLYKVIKYIKNKSREHIQVEGEFVVIQLEQLTYQIFNEVWNMIVGEELVDD